MKNLVLNSSPYLELFAGNHRYCKDMSLRTYSTDDIVKTLKSKLLLKYPVKVFAPDRWQAEINWDKEHIKFKHLGSEGFLGFTYSDFGSLLLESPNVSFRYSFEERPKDYRELIDLTYDYDKKVSIIGENFIETKNINIWVEDGKGQIAYVIRVSGLTESFFKYCIPESELGAPYRKSLFPPKFDTDFYFMPKTNIDFLRSRGTIYWSYSSGRREDV